MLLQHSLSNRNRESLYWHETLYFDLSNERFLNLRIEPGPQYVKWTRVDQGIKKNSLEPIKPKGPGALQPNKGPLEPQGPEPKPGKTTKFVEANRFSVKLCGNIYYWRFTV